MFATCLFCNGPLGKNEAIEHFPVGRRLAFDQSRGRLWVVCPKCERWNLSPLEERWEAIEEAERAFRDGKKRITTDNIGLARVGDGLDLVRIGSPMRAEFAGWRYGDQFGRRRRQTYVYGALAAAGGLGAWWLGPMGAGIIAGGGGGLINAFNLVNIARIRLWTAATFRTEDGTIMRLSQQDLTSAKIGALGTQGDLRLTFNHRHWRPAGGLLTRLGVKQVPSTRGLDAELHGNEVNRALAAFLPVTNGSGGSQANIRDAVQLVENNGARSGLIETTRRAQFAVKKLPAPLRLALEMSLHEDDERRALEGELQELEQRWRDAEEIAAISDSLTLPPGTDEELEQLKRLRKDND